MRERIGYYDIARGLGIIFVVIGHIDTFYEPFRSYVISFHMALFLIVSAMLMVETGEDRKGFWRTAGKKAIRIMVPYFLFSLISVGIEGVRLLTEGVFYWPHLRSLLLTTLTLQGTSVMWFLPAIFFSEIWFLAFRKLAAALCRIFPGKRRKGIREGMPGDSVCGLADADRKNQDMMRDRAVDVVTVVLVLVFVGSVIWSNIFELSFYAGRVGIEKYERLHEVLSMLIRSSVCTFFIAVGYFVRKYLMSSWKRMGIYLAAAIGLLAFCTGMYYVNPGVDLRSLYWGDSGIWVINYYTTLWVKAGMYLLGASAGALGIVFFCRTLEKYNHWKPLKVLSFFGANSLIIMATHLDFHVMHYCMELTAFFNRYVDSRLFYHICLLILVFTVEVAVIRVINRYFPVLAGKRKHDFS